MSTLTEDSRAQKGTMTGHGPHSKAEAKCHLRPDSFHTWAGNFTTSLLSLKGVFTNLWVWPTSHSISWLLSFYFLPPWWRLADWEIFLWGGFFKILCSLKPWRQGLPREVPPYSLLTPEDCHLGQSLEGQKFGNTVSSIFKMHSPSSNSNVLTRPIVRCHCIRFCKMKMFWRRAAEHCEYT